MSVQACASFRAGGELCPRGVVDLLSHAQAAESAGFGDFDAADHVLLGPDPQGYPGGTFRWDVESFWPDPLMVLCAVGAVTSKMLLTTSVLVIGLRPAVVVAKMAATLDNLSDGRLRLGVGAGWNRVEFAAAGVPFAGRTARLEDAVGACRALWRDAPASFRSGTVGFDTVWSRPAPRVADGIPILFAGPATETVATRIARLGEGWLPMVGTAAVVAQGVRYLRTAFERAGRDPRTAVVRVPISERLAQRAYHERRPGLLRDAVDELVEVGATEVKIYVSGLASSYEEVADVLGWIASSLGLGTPST